MVQTVQKIVKFPHAFLDKTGVVQTVQKTVKIPHAFLDMVHARRCATTGWMVETAQKTTEFPQLVLALGPGC